MANSERFNDLTFFGQDWGGLIGLRLIARQPKRFVKVSMGNTDLPYNPDVSEEVIKKVKDFRENGPDLSLLSMAKELRQMDGESLGNENRENFIQHWSLCTGKSFVGIQSIYRLV